MKVYKRKDDISLLEEYFTELKENLLKEDLVDQLVNKINNPFIKGFIKLSKQKIPVDSLSTNLGLDKFKNIYIQKFTNIPFPIYVISVDSKHLSRPITSQQVKQSKSLQFKRVTSTSDNLISMTPKLSPIVRLDNYTKANLPKGSLIIIRDFAGDDYVNKKYHS
jgi:hypothetical protein